MTQFAPLPAGLVPSRASQIDRALREAMSQLLSGVNREAALQEIGRLTDERAKLFTWSAPTESHS